MCTLYMVNGLSMVVTVDMNSSDPYTQRKPLLCLYMLIKQPTLAVERKERGGLQGAT